MAITKEQGKGTAETEAEKALRNLDNAVEQLRTHVMSQRANKPLYVNTIPWLRRIQRRPR